MDTTYSPKQFGQLIGRAVNTLQKGDRKGVLHAHRSPTNRRYYPPEQDLAYRGLLAQASGKVMVYARVSSVGHKPDLANQVAALRASCARHGYQPDAWIEEIGSGLNDQRQHFNRLMEPIEVLGQVRRLIIAHKDRLVRFGFEWFAAFGRRHGTARHGTARHGTARHGTDLLIVNGDTLSPQHELGHDLLSIVDVCSARL